MTAKLFFQALLLMLSIRVAAQSVQQADSGATRIIRILVAYTPPAMDSLGGSDAANGAIINACQHLNLALANSLTQVQTSLVRTLKYDAPQVMDFYENVFAFAGNNQVSRLRNNYRADLAVLVVDNQSMCGMPLIVNALAEQNTAYCAVDWRCMENAYGLPHMVGHLFGAGHYPTQQADPPDDAVYARGHAYTWSFFESDCGFTTIMGYYDDQNCCWSEIGKGPLIPYFSNPEVQYSGVPTGVQGSCDNAGVISEKADSLQFFDLVSNWRISDTIRNSEIAILQARQILHSDGNYWIRDSSMAVFQAATRITLEPGFKADEGTYFETILDSAMLHMR